MIKRMAAIVILAAIAFGSVAAIAQVVPAPQGTAAMVCANNTIVPTPISGKFFYVQCDSTCIYPSGKCTITGD